MINRCLSILSSKAFTIVFLVLNLLACSEPSAEISDGIFESVALAAEGGHRSEENIARNSSRHPVETLAFFGLQPDMTVVEISPGALWYTEILAPVLKHKGRLIAAAYDASLPNMPPYQARLTNQMLERFKNEPSIFSEVQVTRYTPPEIMQLGDDSSADLVLTFRNSHGWVHAGSAGQVYKSFFAVLKAGGVLGVVQHRGEDRLRPSSNKMSGYLSEATVIALAEDAGFVLEAKSEINANPKDTKDYERGVWTLPPVLQGNPLTRNRYVQIGESDRMTLKFRKPL